MKNNVFSKLLKGIQEAREGKTKTYSSEEFDQWIKNRDNWRKKHPVLAFLKDTWYWPGRFYQKLKDLKRDFISFFQRGYRGWAVPDTWWWDSYNAKVQRDVIKHLRDNKTGIPGDFCYDSEKKQEIPWEEAEKAFNAVLDKIIYAFDMIVQLSDGKLEHYCPTATEQWKQDFEKKFETRFITKEENDKIKEGLRLYAEHYFCLSD